MIRKSAVNKNAVVNAAALLGSKGGKARAAKHSPEELSAWAKKGGRPKKKPDEIYHGFKQDGLQP